MGDTLTLWLETIPTTAKRWLPKHQRDDVHTTPKEATTEPLYSPTYARLCARIGHISVPNLAIDLKSLIIERYQEEFNNLIKIPPIYSSSITGSDKWSNYYARKTAFNLMTLGGELFKIKIIRAPMLHEFLTTLLARQDNHFFTECFCALMAVVGNELGSLLSELQQFNAYFEDLEAILENSNTLLPIVRFKILDIIDLKKEGGNAKKIVRIQKA
ncbi:Eukaryotic translation initiation factor 4 gamma [Trichoplax sp. H2]|nr:Eukaryotic translation initiation factor 4 gamma [Trichoplax sp. H2]|eukprot:RDD36810.1 Eukaryotic translation initiation factor 4 gamma [Trichoplax sp. H2]